jgi:hypothetical protein
MGFTKLLDHGTDLFAQRETAPDMKSFNASKPLNYRVTPLLI